MLASAHSAIACSRFIASPFVPSFPSRLTIQLTGLLRSRLSQTLGRRSSPRRAGHSAKEQAPSCHAKKLKPLRHTLPRTSTASVSVAPNSSELCGLPRADPFHQHRSSTRAHMPIPKCAEGVPLSRLVQFLCKTGCHKQRYGKVSKESWEAMDPNKDADLYVTCLFCSGRQMDKSNWLPI